MEFPEGRGVHFVKPILENPVGRGLMGKIPSVGGGGMDIFWNYTFWLFINNQFSILVI